MYLAVYKSWQRLSFERKAKVSAEYSDNNSQSAPRSNLKEKNLRSYTVIQSEWICKIITFVHND